MARDAAGRFSSQLAGIQQAIDQTAADVAIMLDLELLANLREDTPVATGWAAANWHSSVGVPSNALDGTQPEPGTKSTAGALQAAGQTAVLAYAIAQGSIWVGNNVPYINLLDLGYSQQRPSGFVQDCLDRAVATVQARFTQLTIDVSTPQSLARDGGNNLAAAYSPFGDD